MEKTESLNIVHAAIHQVQEFLEPYLALANTHGAEFLSGLHWHKFVSQSSQASLLRLSREELVNLPLLTFQEDCKDKKIPFIVEYSENEGENAAASKPMDSGIQDLRSFVSQAQRYHLEELNVVTAIEAVLPHIVTDDPSVISEAMSVKKIHEVGIMVDAVSAFSKSTQCDLVVDIGSGKGYFASEFSHKENIPVVGFDSRDTNTHGASNRDKRLAKRWAGLERRARKMQSGQNKISENKQKIEGCDDSCLPQACTNSICSQHTTEKIDNHSISHSAVSSTISSVNATNLSSCERIAPDNGNIQHCQERIEKPLELYAPVTLYVHPEMDLYETIRQTAPHLLQDCANVDSLKLFLSGLHTCGSLAVTTLRLFLQDPRAVALCCVGCCYQLMQENNMAHSENLSETHDLENVKETHFPLSSYGKNLKLHLGRNARNLASQSVHRIQASKQLQGGDFLWRALLNVLLIDLGIPVPDRIMGLRGLNKRCKSFQDYVVRVFEKEGISEQLPEFQVLEDLEARHKEASARMSAFFQLKLVLAPVFEALILLDRLAFLLEQEEVDSAHLVQLFDPVMSPRCFALIATKGKRKL